MIFEEVIDPVLGLLVGVLVLVRVHVIVPVLVLPVMLVILRIGIQGLSHVLTHDKATVVIGVIGAHAVRPVDLRHPVDGIINVSHCRHRNTSSYILI